MGWPLSKVGNRVGALLFQYSPPHNSGVPSWSGDPEYYIHIFQIYPVDYFNIYIILLRNTIKQQQYRRIMTGIMITEEVQQST